MGISCDGDRLGELIKEWCTSEISELGLIWIHDFGRARCLKDQHDHALEIYIHFLQSKYLVSF